MLRPENFDDHSRFRQLEAIPYSELVSFVIDYLKRNSGVMVFFWSFCIVTAGTAIIIRLNLAGYYPFKEIMLHSLLGFIIFPALIIPFHEFMHVIPFWLTGAKKIRAGADLKQYIFYVTAHRHVINARRFRLVALVPFISVTVTLIILVLFLPGLWKWSLSVLLFVHTTMCAGDFAMMNFYHLNRHRKIYTWDDADEKMAYFYEEL